MLISPAHAQETETAAQTLVPTAGMTPAPAQPPGSAVAWNVGLILVLVVMFYMLLIRPQQKRFQEHKAMLDALKPGDRVVTAGGLVGKLDSLGTADDEVIVDLGNGIKVTAMRSTIQTKVDSEKK